MLHIVTDSCALFAHGEEGQFDNLRIAPNTLHLLGEKYRENVDLHVNEAMQMMLQDIYASRIESPTVADFAQIYTQLAATSEGIISIHPSRKLFPSWENALMAARHIGGHCPIEVIDSQTISAGQAMLVDMAFKCSQQQMDFEDVVRKVRGAADRVYSVFCVDTLDALLQNKVLSSSHAILGAMLGIKPFLMIEEGMLKAVEKVNSRTQVVERLVEYVVEFTEIEDVVILQNDADVTDEVHAIQDQLAIAFEGRYVPSMMYGPSLARLIGLDALGIFVLESESELFDDDFP